MCKGVIAMVEPWEANFLQFLQEMLDELASDTELDLGDENNDC